MILVQLKPLAEVWVVWKKISVVMGGTGCTACSRDVPWCISIVYWPCLLELLLTGNSKPPPWGCKGRLSPSSPFANAGKSLSLTPNACWQNSPWVWLAQHPHCPSLALFLLGVMTGKGKTSGSTFTCDTALLKNTERKNESGLSSQHSYKSHCHQTPLRGMCTRS